MPTGFVFRNTLSLLFNYLHFIATLYLRYLIMNALFILIYYVRHIILTFRNISDAVKFSWYRSSANGTANRIFI